jgi:hypothetical protein
MPPYHIGSLVLKYGKYLSSPSCVITGSESRGLQPSGMVGRYEARIATPLHRI